MKKLGTRTVSEGIDFNSVLLRKQFMSPGRNWWSGAGLFSIIIFYDFAIPFPDFFSQFRQKNSLYRRTQNNPKPNEFLEKLIKGEKWWGMKEETEADKNW